MLFVYTIVDHRFSNALPHRAKSIHRFRRSVEQHLSTPIDTSDGYSELILLIYRQGASTQALIASLENELRDLKETLQRSAKATMTGIDQYNTFKNDILIADNHQSIVNQLARISGLNVKEYCGIMLKAILGTNLLLLLSAAPIYQGSPQRIDPHRRFGSVYPRCPSCCNLLIVGKLSQAF